MMKNHSAAGTKALLAATPGPRAGGISVLSIFLPFATRKRSRPVHNCSATAQPSRTGQSKLIASHRHSLDGQLTRPSTGSHPTFLSPHLAQAGEGYPCPSPPLSILSLHTPANRKQSLENARHEVHAVLGPLPRDRLVIQRLHREEVVT